MNKRIVSLALSTALVISAGVAAYAVLADARSSHSETRMQAGGADAAIPSPTPTIARPQATTRADIDSALAREAPNLLKAIGFAERSDLTGLSEFMSWKQIPCTTGDTRGGIAPACKELGLAEGATVPMFHYLLQTNSYFTRSGLDSKLGPFLKAKPSLGLITRNTDGTGLITFTLNDPAQPDLRGLDFQVDFNSATPLLGFVDRFVGSTPLDSIREDAARSGKPQPSILYISPAMKAWEDEKSAAQSSPQPAPGVKPN